MLNDFSQIEAPPQSLYPFFVIEGERPCVLSRYFHKVFDCFTGSFEDFILSLKNTEAFKRFIFTFYCKSSTTDINSVIQGDPKTISRIIAAHSNHGDNLPYIADLFFHFPELVTALVKQLYKIKPIIENLHRINRKQVSTIIESILAAEQAALLIKWARIPNSVNLQEQTFSVCFVNPAIIYYTSRLVGQTRQYLFMFGYVNTNTKLLSMSTCRKTFTSIDILKTLGHGLRYEIIELLRQKPMTVSQLSQELHIARTSIIRCIAVLLDETVILHSSQKGAEKYYKLNLGYFVEAHTQLNQYFDTFLLYSE